MKIYVDQKSPYDRNANANVRFIDGDNDTFYRIATKNSEIEVEKLQSNPYASGKAIELPEDSEMAKAIRHFEKTGEKIYKFN